MPQSPSVASDSWTLPQRAAIVDQYNQSGASTGPQEPKPSKWAIMPVSRQAPIGAIIDAPGDEEGWQEPIRALIDCEFGVRPSDVAKLFRELATKQADAHSNAQQMRLRLSYLKLEAKAEGERLNSASEHDFWQFITSIPFVKKPSIFLVENGDFRAVWKGKEGVHIGLQFLGAGEVQYVIFTKRRGARRISRGYGRDTFNGIMRQIADFEIQDLIYG